MTYFSYNDYMDYTENREIDEVKKVEENILKYEIKNLEKITYNENKILEILKNRIELKNFIAEFLNLSTIINTEKIIYCNDIKCITDKQRNSIICKIENKEIFIFIKVIDKIDVNISYKIFEHSLNIIKKWMQEKLENKRYPIVIPIVIYIGKELWKNNSNNKYNKVNYIKFENNRIKFAYNMINVSNLNFDNLKNMKSKIAKQFVNFKINIYK